MSLTTLKTFIENAPKGVRYNPEVAGYRGFDWTICAECGARIMARGCRLPQPNSILWAESHSRIPCDLSDYHE